MYTLTKSMGCGNKFAPSDVVIPFLKFNLGRELLNYVTIYIKEKKNFVLVPS